MRGPQFDAAVCDELASWGPSDSTWDMLQFGLRLGQNPKTVVATTPRPTRLLRSLVQREGKGVVITRGTSYENRQNLAPGFLTASLRSTKARDWQAGNRGRVARRHAGCAVDIAMLERARRSSVPDFVRVVVGIDPAVSTKEGSDETGICVCGKDERGHGWVLEDLSGRYQPSEWARIAVEAYKRHCADRVIAEMNSGRRSC